MANFKDIVGQNQIKKHFQESIKKRSLSHSYIINGEAGSGRHLHLQNPSSVKTEPSRVMPAGHANPAFRLILEAILIYTLSPMKSSVLVLMIYGAS